ncbi:hypothetical protein [Thiomicrospira sp. ALE5]|uniref:hypothetical protein n=1 Tax=Thiomicrospira sp. ALE5 TaxID=748650 RepID=UPI001F2A874A|nr:hypothetical protein [Thiomicrospira sp. ALE5]
MTGVGLAVWGLALFGLAWSAVMAQPPTSQQTTQATRPAEAVDVSRLQMLDYEIALLRAEIALRQGDRNAFFPAYEQLRRLPAIHEFELRWQWVSEQAERLGWLTEDVVSAQVTGFAQASLADRMTLIAPLSGELSPAGLALKQVLLAHYPHKDLSFVDTTDEPVAVLIETIEATGADLLIILERRELTSRLAQHFHDQPAILFHPARVLDPRFQRVLNPTYEQQAMALESWLTGQHAQGITWLQWRDASSHLINRVNLQLGENYQPLIVESNAQLNDLVAQRFGHQESRARQNWLARVIERPLTGIGRSRQDQTLVVFYGPIEQAMLLRPLLEYHQQDLPILWLPSELPDPTFFKSNLSRWQSTYALLPSHFLAEVNQNKSFETEDGLFFALGEVVVELIRRSGHLLPDQFATEFGEVFVTERGEFSLGQQWYYLNAGLVPVENVD